MSDDPVAAYLVELRRQLRTDPWLAKRVLLEVADHLDESATAEQESGVEAGDARRRAVERFGTAADFARTLPADNPALRLLTLAGACGSIAVGLLVSWIVVFLLPAGNADQIPFWTVVACGFLAYGSMTWLYFSSQLRLTLGRLLASCSAAAILAGLSATVHSVYLAWATNDWEAYITLFGLVLTGHGVVLLIYLWRGERAERLIRTSSSSTSLRP